MGRSRVAALAAWRAVVFAQGVCSGGIDGTAGERRALVWEMRMRTTGRACALPDGRAHYRTGVRTVARSCAARRRRGRASATS